jgi:hypothetical protein
MDCSGSRRPWLPVGSITKAPVNPPIPQVYRGAVETDYPILEFDPDEQAVIEPHMVRERLDVPILALGEPVATPRPGHRLGLV